MDMATLYWVFGHIEVIGNAKVDELARKRASTIFIEPEHFCGTRTKNRSERIRTLKVSQELDRPNIHEKSKNNY